MKTDNHRTDYSLVVPVYFNEGSLRGLYDGLKFEVFSKYPQLKGEIVFVDDGSADHSYEVLRELQVEHPTEIRVIKLSRNFGQVNAVWCGMAHARGRAIIVLSADQQEPTDLIGNMLEEYFEHGQEIVIGTRAARDESAWRKWTASAFYGMMRRLCFSNMPKGGFDVYLLGPRARSSLLSNYQPHGFLQGQILRLGFSPRFIEYHRLARKSGSSRWTFGRKLTYLLDGILGYSFTPIRIMISVGCGIAGLGFLYALYIFVHWVRYGHPISGWSPLMIVILVMGGMQTMMLGIIGEYIWRTKALIADEAPYIIECIHESEDQVEQTHEK